MSVRRIILLSLIICTAICILTPLIVIPGSLITRQNAERIHAGMTLTEVEAILGGPARDESTGPLLYDGGVDICPPINWPWDPTEHTEWRSDYYIIILTMNRNERVITCRCSRVRPAQENSFQTVCRLIRIIQDAF
jgi:hypothetical protein